MHYGNSLIGTNKPGMFRGSRIVGDRRKARGEPSPDVQRTANAEKILDEDYFGQLPVPITYVPRPS